MVLLFWCWLAWLTQIVLEKAVKLMHNAVVKCSVYKTAYSILVKKDTISSGFPVSPGSIIDFPNTGITYNGGWCSATIAR